MVAMPRIFDVAIIGGGIVGCASLYHLTSAGYSCLLLEKNDHLMSGASSGNSAQAHMPYTLDGSTVEGICLQSVPEAIHVCKELSVPSRTIGAIMVAFDHNEMSKIREIYERDELRGGKLKLLSKEEIKEMEPHLTQDIIGGMLVPGETVIDSWMYGIAMAHSARRQGAQALCKSQVSAVHQLQDKTWRLQSTDGKVFFAKSVINAAGLFGDVVDALKGSGEAKFKIKPRKGQYVVYEARPLLKHIIIPVPTETSRGVLIFPTVYGNIIVGPTASESEEREKPLIEEKVTLTLQNIATRMLPKLANVPVLGSYAGLRPGTEHVDYKIYHDDRYPGWITAGGIRSTGVSASQGIAKLIKRMLINKAMIHPSGVPTRNNGNAVAMTTKNHSVVLDGVEYHATHPITQYGLWKKKPDERSIKAKL